MNITYIINNDCWECTSHACDSNGYPVIRINGKQDRIHRHYYRQHNGVIPSGFVIRHSCDNRKCINPEHLSIGTHADNVSDRVARDRSAKGENNGRNVLTIREVQLIRLDNSTPKMELARLFKVDPKTIRDIKQGKTWAGI
jgi:hypothetical protein